MWDQYYIFPKYQAKKWFIETVDVNLRLGPKLPPCKKSTVLALLWWNLAIIVYSWGADIDQVCQNLWMFY